MPSFYNLTSGNTAQTQDVQQIIDALKGTAGLGVPLSPTAVNDSVNFALAVKNLDTTNSRALQVVRANNTVLLQADVNGLIGSVDGTTAPAQLVNVSLAQTLTNKTINGLGVATGGVTVSGAGPTYGLVVNPTTGFTSNTVACISGLPIVPSTTTASAYAVEGAITTAAAAFSLTSAIALHAGTNTKGAGSTITSSYGLFVESQNAGSTNNYGIFVNGPSGGSGANLCIMAQNADSAFGTANIGNGATIGFLYITSGGGSPTGVPVGVGGYVPMRYDTSTHKLWIYDGGWKGALFS